MALRMSQLEDGLAVVKIVPRKEQIEARQIFAQQFHFGRVKVAEQCGDGLGRQHGC